MVAALDSSMEVIAVAIARCVISVLTQLRSDHIGKNHERNQLCLFGMGTSSADGPSSGPSHSPVRSHICKGGGALYFGKKGFSVTRKTLGHFVSGAVSVIDASAAGGSAPWNVDKPPM